MDFWNFMMYSKSMISTVTTKNMVSIPVELAKSYASSPVSPLTGVPEKVLKKFLCV